MSELFVSELKAQRNSALDANAELRARVIELSNMANNLQTVVASQSTSLSKVTEELNAAKLEVADLKVKLEAATAPVQRKKKAPNAGDR